MDLLILKFKKVLILGFLLRWGKKGNLVELKRMFKSMVGEVLFLKVFIKYLFINKYNEGIIEL